jgi:hypothetical protein
MKGIVKDLVVALNTSRISSRGGDREGIKPNVVNFQISVIEKAY